MRRGKKRGKKLCYLSCLFARRREHLLCLDGLKRVEENVNKQLRIVVMSESEVHRSFTLLDSVKFLRCRLTVAAVELGQRLEDRAYIAQVPFALFVLRQPFPCVYTKGLKFLLRKAPVHAFIIVVGYLKTFQKGKPWKRMNCKFNSFLLLVLNAH